MSNDETSRYEAIEYDECARWLHNEIKAACLEIETRLSDMRHSRELAIAKTKLEEAFMWIGKAIKSDQIQRYNTPHD